MGERDAVETRLVEGAAVGEKATVLETLTVMLTGAVRDRSPESDGDSDSKADADDEREMLGDALGRGESDADEEARGEPVTAILTDAVLDAELD